MASDTVLVRTDSLVRDDPARAYAARIAFPQLDNAPSPINTAIRDSVAALADRYRPLGPPRAGDRGTQLTGGFETLLHQNGLYSALVEVYADTGGAHGVTVLVPINADTQAGRLLALRDLFGPDVDVPAVLSVQAEAALRADAAVAANLFPDLAPDAFRRYAAFTLGQDSLALYYEPYALGPYAAGAFRALLAYSDLGDALRAGGPIARLRP